MEQSMDMTTNPPAADPINRILATFWDAVIQLSPQWLTLPITLLVGGLLGKLVGALASLVGLALGLWGMFQPGHRALHDPLAGTRVVMA